MTKKVLQKRTKTMANVILLWYDSPLGIKLLKL